MCERWVRRGVLVAAGLAGSLSLAQAQEASTLPLKPSLLDQPSAASSDEATMQTSAVIMPAPEEPVVVRKKKPVVDPYAPLGIRTGGITLYPTLEIGGLASSNAAQAATPKADGALRLKPGLRFESDWSRHAWTGAASAEITRYLSDPDLSTLTGSANTNFRLDIRRTTHADFSADFASNETGLGDSSLPATAAEPRRDKTFSVGADLVHDFGGLEGSVKMALARSIFEDVALSGGGTEVNSDRNYDEPTLTLRASLGDFGAPIKPYVEVAYAPRVHDQTLDRNGLDRNSLGLAGTLGVTVKDDPIWQGDLALTYLVRNYADATLPDASVFGLKGKVTWRPTQLFTVEATTGVSLGETVTAGVGGTRSWTAGLNATYALRENVNLLAGLGYTRQDTGTAITASKTAMAGIDWTLNPNMTAGISYQGTWYDDGTALGTGNYNDQRVMTSITLRK